MSNVEYRCPVRTDGVPCGIKHFGLPGGTSRKCRIHDVQFVQTEEAQGPDFLYIDVEGHTKTKDIIDPHDKTRSRAEVTNPGDSTVSMDPDAELDMYRQMYIEITGTQVDKRWAVATIKEQIKVWREGLLAGSVEGQIDPAGEPNGEDDPAAVDETNNESEEDDESVNV